MCGRVFRSQMECQPLRGGVGLSFFHEQNPRINSTDTITNLRQRASKAVSVGGSKCLASKDCYIFLNFSAFLFCISKC